MKRTVLSLILVMAACAGLFAQDFVTTSDIPYSPSSDRYAVERCRLDIYHPAQAPEQGLPVVVWFHGGGLTSGSKAFPETLFGEGIVMVTVNYRLLPKCTLDDCIDDAAAAVAWTFNNVAKYGGDPAKIYVSGHSAGGYLTDMVGLDKKWLAKYGIDADRIKALVPFSGQCITHFAQRQLHGISELQPTIDEYAPLFHIRPDAPPMLILSGDRELELYGRYEEQAYFWRMLKLVGHPDVKLLEIQGFTHGSMGSPAQQLLLEFIREREK